MDKITVIIPVYKVEEYLEKCLDSVIAQTYRNLQIIVIDDGSPDNCGKICDKYERLDSRIKVIHKENGGQGSARNLGLDIAEGEYIAFVDSDDWCSPDMMESMHSAMKENDCDVAICGSYQVRWGKVVGTYNACKDAIVMDNPELMKMYYTSGIISSGPCDKMFKKSLWETMRFPEVKMREDEFILYKIFSMAKKAIHIGKPEYYYNVREGSTEHRKYNEKFLISNESIDNQYEYVKKEYPELTTILWDRRILSRIGQLRTIICTHQCREYKNIVDEMIVFLKNHTPYDAKLKKEVKLAVNNFGLYKFLLTCKYSVRQFLKRIVGVLFIRR